MKSAVCINESECTLKLSSVFSIAFLGSSFHMTDVTPNQTNTLFSNSLVRARPALSRKILSSWMARANIARAWPALFWCCFYQHQSSARPAPGADQRVSERSSTKLRPKFRLHSQMPHNSRAVPRRRGFVFKLKLFCHILIIFLFVFFSFKQNVLH